MEKNGTRRQTLADALTRGNVAEATQQLGDVVAAHPNDWVQKILEEGALDPGKPSFHVHAQVLLKILAGVQGEGPPCLEQRIEVMGLVAALGRMALGFDELRKEIAGLTFWNASKATRTWALATWLQAQATAGLEQVDAVATNGGAFDPLKALQAVVPTVGGAGSVNIGTIVETLTEDVERILRFQSHTRGNEPWGTLSEVSAVRDSEDFGKLVRATQLWRMYEYVWGSVRFGGWRVKAHANGLEWTPLNENEFLVVQTGALREQLVAETALMPLLETLVPDGAESYRETMTALAATMRFPDPGMPWSLEVERPLLRRLVQMNPQRAMAQAYVGMHHLDGVLPLLPQEGAGITWDVWLELSVALHALAEAVKLAFASGRAGANRSARHAVVCVKRTRLAEVLSAVTGLAQDVILKGVLALTFDARRKTLELWDQPLIAANDEVILVPDLIEVVNPARTVEHRLPFEAFAERGAPFEGWIRDLLRNRGLAAQSGIKFDASDGRDAEFDVLAWWDGYLLVIETKCIKSTSTPQDDARARRELRKAFTQLQRRRGLVQTDWEMLRKKSVDVPLPPDPVADDHVITVAVMNVLQFTTLTDGPSVATDEFCLDRYFQDPKIEVRVVGPDNVAPHVVGKIREGPPTPLGLLAYLRGPPQVKMVRENLIRQCHCLPVPGGEPMLVPAAAFGASDPVSAYAPVVPSGCRA